MTRWIPIGFALVALVGTPSARAEAEHNGVRDQAHLFSAEAVEKANETLQRLRKTHPWDVLIQTVESLDGESPQHRAIANAKELKLHGLYLLIAKAEHKLWIEPSQSAREVFPKAEVEEINHTLAKAFKERHFDEGLQNAVAEIERAVGATAKRGGHAKAATPIPAADIPDVNPPAKGGSMLPTLLIGGIGIVVVLWLLSRVFGRSRPQGAYGDPQGPPPGYGAGGYRPGVNPGPPGGGPPPYGYGPQPGYAPPGYGAPPRQGGGFVSSALGGIGGAIVGNILYDEFGRPHTPEGQPIHQGDVTGGGAPTYPAGGTEQPQETYDPNAGAGSDWGGTPDNSQQAAPDWNSGGGTSGDWGSDDQSAGAGGDWGSPDNDDAGAQGDWGGDAGSDDDNRGGDW